MVAARTRYTLLGRRPPEWDAEELDFAAAWRSQPKWVVSRSLKSVGPNATLVRNDVGTVLRELKARLVGEIDVAGPDLARSTPRSPLRLQMVIRALSDLIADDAVISLDCSANTHFAARCIKLRARSRASPEPACSLRWRRNIRLLRRECCSARRWRSSWLWPWLW